MEIDASSFLQAATQLARLHQIFGGLTEAYSEPLVDTSVGMILPAVRKFRSEAENVGARLSVVSADRMISTLERKPCPMSVGQAVLALNDIESRFADFLSEVRMFALSSAEAIYLQSADELIELPIFSANFPQSSFEIEEASKCVALGRYTAAVFHAMRMLEIGIRALSKRLSIPDPTKPAEKNWAKILNAIREKIDELWPASGRMPNSEGSAFEQLHANLDAVRNPWRNATMHVETIYAPHEALHIIRCAAFFMRRLSELSDEQGNPPEAPKLPELAMSAE